MPLDQVDNPYNLEYNKHGLPVLQHQEVYLLYGTDLDIKQEDIDFILSLPRATLTADLEKLLYDAVIRADDMMGEDIEEIETAFPIHAMFFLTELNAEESLPAILEFLRLEEAYLGNYLGDYLTEVIWECLLTLGGNQKDLLFAFITDENVYAYARVQVSVAMAQRALHFPEEKAEIEEWFRDLLIYFHQDEIAPHPTTLGLIIGDILNMRGFSLYEEVRKLYADGLVNPRISGTWDEVEGNFLEKVNKPYDPKITLRTIQERYTYFLRQSITYNRAKTKFTRLKPRQNPNTIIRAGAKVGRNDPCPCGSGKKYKKCCLNM